MEFIPYKINESFENLYYQIPMELFFNHKYKDSIDPVGKLVYGFLLNRLSLSAKNNWIDSDGNIFLIFTRKEVKIMKNKELKRKITDEKTGINYTLVGDYYLPNLLLPKEDKETENKNIGKYGLLRLDFLKEHKRGLYQELLIKNQRSKKKTSGLKFPK